MSKIITLRLSEDEYEKISTVAKMEHRPISNFIAATILKSIEELHYVDPVEMAQIKSDKELLKRLKAGHTDAAQKKGKLIG